VIRRLLPVGLLSLFLLNLACDEGESSLGGNPGGQAAGEEVIRQATQTLGFARNQSLSGAGLQTMGRSDSMGFESAMLLQFDYNPVELWETQPDSGSFTPTFSLKFSNKEQAIWLPQLDEAVQEGPSRWFLDLELSMLEDSLAYDSLSWQDAFADDEPLFSVLDTLSFRITSADTSYGEGEDPSTGFRTYVDLPAEWFTDSTVSSRTFLLRAMLGQEGLMSCLASGYSSSLRPNLRFASSRLDSVEISEGVFEDETQFDTTSVAATWQTGLVKDAGADEGFHSLSSGWASQLLISLPKFMDELPDSYAYDLPDSLRHTLTEAWLELPVEAHTFNAEGAKVNIYRVDGMTTELDTSDLELESDHLVTSTVISDSLETLDFNIIGLLRSIWLEQDSLINSDPIVLGIKLDDYYHLQPRKILVPMAGEDGPKLRYSLSESPWGND
jgi:hypothetical protein